MKRSTPACLSLVLLLSSCGPDSQGLPEDEGMAPGAGGEMQSPASGGAPSSGGLGSGGMDTSTGGGSGGEASGGAASSGGSPLGTGGEVAASGGAPVDDEVEELLSEFAAFWDFETVEGQSVQPMVGDAILELSGAAVGPGTKGNELGIANGDSTAESAAPILNTSLDFSVSTWVRLDELDGYDTFVSMAGSALSAFFLQKRDDDRFSFVTFSGDATSVGACVATGEMRPRAGEWYHVVGTYSAQSGEQRVYVDGVLSGRTTCPDGVFDASGGLKVGRGYYDGAATDPWAGAVDDLGLIARVLTPAEIATLYRHGRPQQKNYLFAYFVEVTQGRGDGLRLAHSHDGRHWGAIGGGRVFMPASVGGGSFRDPHLLRAPDGLYHLVWTTSCVPWAEANCVQDRGLGHATSPDLVTWSQARYITVDRNVEHVWAPETFYHEESGQMMIYWSSPIDHSESSDPHDIYYILTEDFETFTEPEVLYSRPGRNFIDATIYSLGDEYLMVLKDEADGQKNLRALVSPELFGPGAWTADPSAPITGSYAAEGPSFLERDGTLFIYFDKYGEGAYGALQGTLSGPLDTPEAWQDISAEVFFPGVRHGTAIEVPWDVFEAVAIQAGQ